jgi:hypothetical protein
MRIIYTITFTQMKKASLFLVFMLSFLLIAPGVLAQTPSSCGSACTATNTTNCWADYDGDGWASKYHDGYQLYTASDFGQTCLLGTKVVKKGDCADINPMNELNPNFNGLIKDNNGNVVKSSTIYPGAMKIPGDGVDHDCSGNAAEIGGANTPDAQSLLNNVRNFLTWAVVGISGLILIWGGIMYAMAAGDEQKTKKARKAIIGAVIGLIVGLLAYAIIGIVAQNIVNK